MAGSVQESPATPSPFHETSRVFSNSVEEIIIYVPVVFMARYVMVLRSATSLRLFWAQKSLDFQGPPLPMPRVMMLHSSKPLNISAIKTTGTLVVLCSRVLLSTVVVCCCLLLCVVVCCCVLEGVGRSLCSCVVLAGIQGVGAGWQGSPSPSHYSVGIHGCLLVGGGVL
jgi:hypothetical protein